ncbi:MAG TPA: helix-turn-helix transcriptional regulator [Thermoanaerobaculia bacterium]|jgi:transcriptional regulator with XRE-family HTH domain|nr:helix-turn-helix transcriptional regulator [Thermoanaerobaculia bacterium]
MKSQADMQPETAHMIQVLRSAVRVLGFTNREIESRLGVSGGYLTRLFNGTLELRFQHIVDIARAMGLEPEEIVQLAYPQPRNPPSESAQRLRETFGPRLAGRAAAPSVEAEKGASESGLGSALEQEMERMMKRVFSRFFAEFMGKAASGE